MFSKVTIYLVIPVALIVLFSSKSNAADVILGELFGTQVYARHNGIAAIAVGTSSCNAGDRELNWKALPSNKHPVITMNMYRLLGGRMTQIGQSWAKHGVFALQRDICNFGCTPGSSDSLGVGCSDPYGTGTNRGPSLGSRRLINPATGVFDGNLAKQELDNFHPSSPIDHGLQVKETDLANPGARYFVEGHYIAADDAATGNGNNNVSHMEVRVTRDGSGNIIIENASADPTPTAREVPAIRAWPYAEFTTHDGSPDDGRILIAHRTARLTRTKYRYEYAIYNMNSDRGVRSLSIPIGAVHVENIGFSSVLSHGEQWDNVGWQRTVVNGRVVWSTETFQQNENANAIRWGTTYNFWFDAEAKPSLKNAEFSKFKPGTGADSVQIQLQVPNH